MSRAKNPSINVLKRNTGAGRIGTGSGKDAQTELNARVIRVADRTEMKGYDVPAGYQFSLSEAGRAGKFRVKSGTPPSDPQEGIYVVLDNGNYAERVFRDTVKAKWFGIVGDGVADDSVAAQAAINSGYNVDWGKGLTIGVTRQYNGTDDRYALNITQSNVKHFGSASFKRLTSIALAADAYPVFLVGTADSNVAAPTRNVKLKGLTFIGNDTRHAQQGNSVRDYRYAFELRNTDGVNIRDCEFTLVDSSVVFTRKPTGGSNSTKNYNFTFKKNSVKAEPHIEAYRALIHAVVLEGADGADVSHNHFEWCDDAVSGAGTFWAYGQNDGDTYTDPTHGEVKRAGRGWMVSKNIFENSSEHTVYLAGMDVTITGNNSKIDDALICLGDFKIKSTNVTMTGNTIIAGSACLDIAELSRDVLASGNTLISRGAHASLSPLPPVVQFRSQGLSTYVDNRPYIAGYPKCGPHTLTGNIIKTFSADQDAIRLYTDISDANYGSEQMLSVTIAGNKVQGGRASVNLFNSLIESVNINGNTLKGLDFEKAAFSASTVVNSHSALACSESAAGLDVVSFTGNKVIGFKHLFGRANGAGTFTNKGMPRPVTSNRLEYIQNMSDGAFKAAGPENHFVNNSGVFWLDRAYSSAMIDNHLGDGGTFNSYYRQTHLFDGTNLRFYTDDAGTYIVL